MMLLPLNPSLSVNRLRLAIQVEWMVALAITAVVLWLDVSYARHAGALWRDETNSVAMTAYPSLSMTWLQFDSFPLFWSVVLRGWIRAGFGQSDAGFRVFGLLMNLGIVAILWLNAWRMSRRPPLVGLTLLGVNAAVMVYCGSIRGYGLGLVLGLWMYGAVWAYVIRPTAARWALAAIAALLACHTLYYNCVFVAAACLAGAGVAVSRRRWRVAASVIAIGAVAAATLPIYLPTFRGVGQWRRMYEYDGGFTGLWLKFVEAVTLGHSVMLPVWVIVLLCAPLAALLTWRRTRNDLALFAAISLSVGLAGNVLFLRGVNYYMQPWYFLCLMAVTAAGADAAQRSASTGRGFRIPAVAMVALALMLISFSPLYAWSITRRTNIDEIARIVARSATRADYIVVTDWVHGITFHRYYNGSAPWQTLPALPPDAHDVHRSDLVVKLIHRTDAISPVLDSVEQTLRSGHRVFYIGPLPEQLPVEHPGAYLIKRLEAHNPPLPLEFWRYELNYMLHELAGDAIRIPIKLNQPISLLEDLELSVFEGRQPSQ